MINIILQSLLPTYFAVFDIFNYFYYEWRSSNHSEHNMVPYFQLIGCFEIFPFIPNAYWGNSCKKLEMV